MEKKTTLKLHYSLDIPQYRTPGGIYKHQGNGGPRVNPGPKYGRGRARTAAKMRQKPCFCGSSRAAHAAFPAALCPVCPLSDAIPDSGFGPLILTNQLSKVNG